MTKHLDPPIDTVEVTLALDTDEVPVGILRRSPRRGSSVVFMYEPAYLGHRRAYELDPDLPLRAGLIRERGRAGLFNAFADAAPDGWGELLMRRTLRLRANEAGDAWRDLEAFDCLVMVRDDVRHGALRLRSQESGAYVASPSSPIPLVLDLPQLLTAAEHLHQGEPTEVEMEYLLAAAGSLGGARPKAAVVDEAGRHCIAKFPWQGVDHFDAPAWEEVAMHLARSSGLDVPSSRLLKVADKSVLLSRRFDRRQDERIGFVSARTLLGATDDSHGSYLEVAEAVSRFGSRVTQDLQELFRRVVFSMLISNADNHLRNIGFLRDGAGWALAPAYDLNPDPRSPGRFMVGIQRDSIRPSFGELLDHASRFGLTRTGGREEIARVIAGTSSWREVAQEVGIRSGELGLVESAFECELRAAALRT